MSLFGYVGDLMLTVLASCYILSGSYPQLALLKATKSYLELLQVWPLGLHDLRQQLVLEPVARHREVDQGALRLQFGLVVRVGQLGVEDQLECVVVFDFPVADFKCSGKGDSRLAEVAFGDNNKFKDDIFV